MTNFAHTLIMTQLRMKEKAKKNNSGLKKGVFIGIILMIVLSGVLFWVKRYMHDSLTEKQFMVYVRPETSYQEVMDTLQNRLEPKPFDLFKRYASLNKLENKMHPGAYRLKPGMSAKDIYRIFAKGLQTPVRFSFNNIRTKEQLATRISHQLMMDSAQVIQMFQDTAFISEMGFDEKSIQNIFLPDSYEIYLTIKPEDLFKRMKREYDRSWNEERRTRAENSGFISE